MPARVPRHSAISEVSDAVRPDVVGLERLGATRMRQYVRAWINEWDLVRLDPAFRAQTVAVEIVSDYREDSDLEGAPVTAGEDTTAG